MNDRVVIVDNFFDSFNLLEEHFKKISLYTLEEFYQKPENAQLSQNWPGKRSLLLNNEEPFLQSLIIKEFKQKFNYFLHPRTYNSYSYLHLRLSNDDVLDFIHKDPVDYTLMVYLSKTNLNSGTILYDKNENPTQTINFVQNRAVIFPGHIKHKSMLNYGNNLDDGRLTLNCFMELC